MKQVWLLAVLWLPTWVSWAEEGTLLEPVVVTATRTPEPQDRTLASVSVIDRAEIERRQFRSVPDALSGLAGISIVSSGGPGQPASVLLRGADSDQVLVLIDGVKVGSATIGATPLEHLPIEQIDRIEVVRGPRSSLYGSEAIGGVIQIFTRRGGGAPRPRVSAGTGSYGTASVSGGISGGGDDGWFNLGANFQQTDGFNACNGQPVPFAGCGVYQPDRDGYRNTGASARAGYRFGEFAEAGVHYLGSSSRTDFDGGPFSGNSSRAEQQVLGAEVRLEPLAAWTVLLSAGQSQDNYRAYYLGDFLDRFDTERDLASLQTNLAVTPDQLLTLGVDYQNDKVDGTIEYTADSRDNTGFFGEYQAAAGAGEVKLSLRQDDNQQFGSHVTGNAALGYRSETDLAVFVSYGTAFKAPTFNDLYFPVFGNSDLDPEQSRSIELGLSGSIPWGGWGLNLYQTEIDDLIAFDSFTYVVDNIDAARIRGLEASASAAWRDWELGANLTLLDPRNRSDGPDGGNLLPRRPEQTFQLTLARRLERWSAGATLLVAGRSFDDLANEVRLDGYTLVGLTAEYALTPAFRVQGRLENLLDEDYETAAFYNQPGRAFYLTLRYEP